MSENRSLKWTMASLGPVGLAGIGAMCWGSSRHVYRVPYEEASAAFMKWCTAEPDVDPIAGEHYLAMFGDRYFWLDFGLGLAASAAAGLLLAAILYFSRPDGAWFRTPSKRWHFMLAGWAVILWSYFALIYSLERDLERQLFPWCADSIAIPIFEAGISTIVLLVVCTGIGFLLMLSFSSLPARLNQWDRVRQGYSWFLTIAFGSLIALVGATMILDATNSMSIANPAGVIAIYLLASTRAALLAPKSAKE